MKIHVIKQRFSNVAHDWLAEQPADNQNHVRIVIQTEPCPLRWCKTWHRMLVQVTLDQDSHELQYFHITWHTIHPNIFIVAAVLFSPSVISTVEYPFAGWRASQIIKPCCTRSSPIACAWMNTLCAAVDEIYILLINMLSSKVPAVGKINNSRYICVFAGVVTSRKRLIRV